MNRDTHLADFRKARMVKPRLPEDVELASVPQLHAEVEQRDERPEAEKVDCAGRKASTEVARREVLQRN